MEERKITEIITVGERQYQLHRLNAMDGIYLAKFVTEKCVPVLNVIFAMFGEADKAEKAKLPQKGRKKVNTKEPTDDDMVKIVIDTVQPILTSLSEDDINKLVMKCLNNVDALLPAGYQKVMEGKDFGVADLEYDLPTCLMLCYRFLAFNTEGFFGENGLDLKGRIQSIIAQLNTQT